MISKFPSSTEKKRLPFQGFTWRAAIVGIVCIAILCSVAPYTDLYMMGSELAGCHIPMGTMALLIFLVVVVNVILGLMNRRWALRPGELMFIFVMMLVSAGLPTFGLTSYLFPVLTAPFYYATPENQFAELFQQYIPKLLAPQDPLAIKYFYEGLPEGMGVPWGVWIKPLLLWSAFIFALYFMMLCLGVIVAKQWIERERLAFPLVELPVEMVERDDDRGLLPPLMRNPLVWMGFLVPVVLHSLNSLRYYFPAFPALPLKDVPLFAGLQVEPWTALRANVNFYFSVIGFSYFLPPDIAFSMWFFFWFHKLQLIAADILGYSQTAGSYETMRAQYIGGFIMFVGMGLWMARSHLRQVWRLAFKDRTNPEAREQGMSYRWAVIGLGAAIVFLCFWCVMAGMSLWVAFATFIIFLIICLGLSRVVAEGGIPFAKATVMEPRRLLVPLTGTNALGPANLTMLSVIQYVFMFDLKCFLMPALMHGHKVGEAARLKRRHLIWVMALGIAVGVLVSYWSCLTIFYHKGGVNMSGWFFVSGPQGNYNQLAGLLTVTKHTEWDKLVSIGLGGGFVAFLNAMRLRFLWWPFHPVGYVLCSGFETSRCWFPFMVGWALKTLTLRYGGLRFYRRGRDICLGLILGEFAIAAIWLVIDYFGGVTSHRIFP